MTTWMAAEIQETPAAVARLLEDGGSAIADAAERIVRYRPRWVTFVGRGTSDHAATYGRYLVETMLGLPSGLAAPSVTTGYGATLRWDGGLLIAVSQSGRSPDLVAVTEAARAAGALTLAVTNSAGSPMAQAAAVVVDCHAGPERAVPATKSYVNSLVALAALVVAVAARSGAPRGAAAAAAALPGLANVLQRVLAITGPWVLESGVVDDLAASDRALVTSRGYDLATALELAIKLKECAGILADGMSSAELEHGPVALAATGLPVLAIRPDGVIGRQVDGALERVLGFGARPWIIGGQETPTPRSATEVERSLQLPIDLPSALAPTAFILAGQLVVEAVTRARGLDPDLPRGLTKVTLTR